MELPRFSQRPVKSLGIKILDCCNGNETHNHLICKWTYKHLHKLTKD